MIAPINSGLADGIIAASTGRLNRGMITTMTDWSAVTITGMIDNIGVGAAGERNRADRFSELAIRIAAYFANQRDIFAEMPPIVRTIVTLSYPVSSVASYHDQHGGPVHLPVEV